MKKSKLLLTLVVVLLLCSMLFALVACGDDNNDGNNTNPDGDDDKTQADPAIREDLLTALKAGLPIKDITKPVGVEYLVSIPLADVDGKPRNIELDFRGVIATGEIANQNKLQLTVNDVKGAGDAKNVNEVFTILLDDKDVYLFTVGGDSKEYNRKFPGLNLGEMFKGYKLPNSDQTIEQLGILDAIFDMFIKDPALVTKNGNVYTAKMDLSEIANMVGPVIGSMIPQLADLDIAGLIGNIKPSFDVTIENKVVTQFNLNLDLTAINEAAIAHVNITPKFGNDVKPTFVDVATKKNIEETHPLNLSMNGYVVFGDDKYSYTLDADIDIFCIFKNLVKFGSGSPEKLFKGTDSKIFIDVKNNDNVSILNVAMDRATLDTEDLVVTFNPAKILPTAFADMIFGKNGFGNFADDMKADEYKVVTIDPAALIADMNQVNSSAKPVPAPSNGPSLSVKADAENELMGVVTWSARKNTTYEIKVDGKAVATPEAERKRISVKIPTGSKIEVVAINSKNVRSAVSSLTYSVAGPEVSVAVTEGSAYKPGYGVATIKAFDNAAKYVVKYVDATTNAQAEKTIEAVADAKSYTVENIKSGTVVEVKAVLKDDKGETGWSKANFMDAKVIADTVSKFVAFFMNGYVDYDSTWDFVLETKALVRALATLDKAANINIFGNDLSAVIGALIDWNKVDELRFSVQGEFFAADKDMDVAAKLKDATGLTPADLNVTKFDTIKVDGKDTGLVKITNNGKSNFGTDNKVVAMTAAELEALLKNATINGKKIGKVIGIDWASTEVQNVKVIIINDVHSTMNGVFTNVDEYLKNKGEFGAYFATEVLYTQIQLKADAQAA